MHKTHTHTHSLLPDMTPFKIKHKQQRHKSLCKWSKNSHTNAEVKLHVSGSLHDISIALIGVLEMHVSETKHITITSHHITILYMKAKHFISFQHYTSNMQHVLQMKLQYTLLAIQHPMEATNAKHTSHSTKHEICDQQIKQKTQCLPTK